MITLAEPLVCFFSSDRCSYGRVRRCFSPLKSRGLSLSVFSCGSNNFDSTGYPFNHILLDSTHTGFKTFCIPKPDIKPEVGIPQTFSFFAGFLRSEKPDLVVFSTCTSDSLAALYACESEGVPSFLVERLSRNHLSKEMLAKASYIYSVDKNAFYRWRSRNCGGVGVSGKLVDSELADISISEVARRYNVWSDSYGVVLFHPTANDQARSLEYISTVAKALTLSGKRWVWVGPNGYEGSFEVESIVSSIKKSKSLSKYSSIIRYLPSMRYDYFLSMVRHCNVVIGNSSAVSVDAPMLGVPSIGVTSRLSDIGIKSVCPVFHPQNADVVLDAIRVCWNRKFNPRSDTHTIEHLSDRIAWFAHNVNVRTDSVGEKWVSQPDSRVC